MAVAATTDPFDNSAQYDQLRQRAAQQNNSVVQSQKDAMARKFASIGAANSGASIKQNDIIDQQGQQNLEGVNQGIDQQQQAENRQFAQIKQGQQFQTSERQAGEAYGTSQADAQRAFEDSELGKQQKFSDTELGKQQSFTSSENQINRDFTADQSDKAQTIQKSQFADSLEQAKAQMEVDKETTEFNERMAVNQANKPTGILSDVLGSNNILSGLLPGGGGGGGGGFAGIKL